MSVQTTPQVQLLVPGYDRAPKTEGSVQKAPYIESKSIETDSVQKGRPSFNTFVEPVNEGSRDKPNRMKQTDKPLEPKQFDPDQGSKKIAEDPKALSPVEENSKAPSQDRDLESNNEPVSDSDKNVQENINDIDVKFPAKEKLKQDAQFMDDEDRIEESIDSVHDIQQEVKNDSIMPFILEKQESDTRLLQGSQQSLYEKTFMITEDEDSANDALDTLSDLTGNSTVTVASQDKGNIENEPQEHARQITSEGKPALQSAVMHESQRSPQEDAPEKEEVDFNFDSNRGTGRVQGQQIPERIGENLEERSIESQEVISNVIEFPMQKSRELKEVKSDAFKEILGTETTLESQSAERNENAEIEVLEPMIFEVISNDSNADHTLSKVVISPPEQARPTVASNPENILLSDGEMSVLGIEDMAGESEPGFNLQDNEIDMIKAGETTHAKESSHEILKDLGFVKNDSVQVTSPQGEMKTPNMGLQSSAVSGSQGGQLHENVTKGIFHQVAFEVKTAAKDGIDRLSMQLKPGSLGKIDIKIEVAQDGRTTVVVNVEKSETYDFLRKDPSGLQDALKEAGIDANAQDMNYNMQGEQQQDQGDEQPNSNMTRLNIDGKQSEEQEIPHQYAQRTTTGTMELFV